MEHVEGWNCLQRQNVFKTRLDRHLRNVKGIYKHLLFPVPVPSMTISSWMDSGNPGINCDL